MTRKRSNTTASLASDGLTRNERWMFRQMAAHEDEVERVIAESTDEDPASRRKVMRAIRSLNGNCAESRSDALRRRIVRACRDSDLADDTIYDLLAAIADGYTR